MSPTKKSRINVSTLPLPNDLLIAPSFGTNASKISLGTNNNNGESSTQGVAILQNTLQQQQIQQQCNVKESDLQIYENETPSNDSTSGSSSSSIETGTEASLEITLPPIALGANVSRTSIKQRQRQQIYLDGNINHHSDQFGSPNKSLVTEGTRQLDVSCHDYSQPRSIHQESSSFSSKLSKDFHPSSIVSSLSRSIARTFSSIDSFNDDTNDNNKNNNSSNSNIHDEELLDEAVEVFIAAPSITQSSHEYSCDTSRISSTNSSTELQTIVSCKISSHSDSTISSRESQSWGNHQQPQALNSINTSFHSNNKGFLHDQQSGDINTLRNYGEDVHRDLSMMSVSDDQDDHDDNTDAFSVSNYSMQKYVTTIDGDNPVDEENEIATQKFNHAVNLNNNNHNSSTKAATTAGKRPPPLKHDKRSLPSDNDDMSISNHRRLDLDLIRQNPPSRNIWSTSDFDDSTRSTSVSSYQPSKYDKIFEQRLKTNIQKNKLPHNPARNVRYNNSKSIYKGQNSKYNHKPNNKPEHLNGSSLTSQEKNIDKQKSRMNGIAFSTAIPPRTNSTILQAQIIDDDPSKIISVSGSSHSSSSHTYSSSSYTSYTNTQFTRQTYDSGRQSSFYTDDETKTYDYTETSGFDNSTWASGTNDHTVDHTASNISKSGLSLENDNEISQKDQSSLNGKNFNYNNLSNNLSDNDNDQVHLSVTAFTTIPYVHCGYAATAPMVLNDKKWMEILKNLMPESYADAISLIKYSRKMEAERVRRGIKNSCPALDPAKIMKWAENNPIVSAYGMLNSDSGRKVNKQVKKLPHNEGQNSDFATMRKLRRLGFKSGFNDTSPAHVSENRNSRQVRSSRMSESSSTSTNEEKQLKPAIEWDVFLDPVLVAQVDKSMDYVNNLRRLSAFGKNDGICDEALIAADIEVDLQVGRLINRMMLAHGSTSQLVAEALGMAPRYTFSRVVEQGESIRRAQQKKNTPLRQKLISVCSNLDVDSTVDDVFTVDNTRATRQVQFAEDQTIKEGRKATKASATGIFAERWLALFASALEMARSDDTTNNNSNAGSSSIFPNQKSSLRKTSSFRRSTSSFLRHDSLTALDPENAHFADVNSFVHHSAKNHDVAVPQTACGLFLCLGMEDPNSKTADHGNTTMAESAKLIKKLLDGQQLKIVMDLKSRRVPPRVWARLIDNLKSRGISVEGIGSFDLDELRSISSLTCTPITGINFFHSAGDLQRACHAKEIRNGDTVYFNAGSLLYKKPTLWEATNFSLCAGEVDVAADMSYGSQKRVHNMDLLGSCDINFQPYAYSRKELRQRKDLGACKATLEDYQKYFDLNIGLYVQEFSIGKEHLNALAIFVNDNSSIYNLGLAWGGLNGVVIKGMKGDGFWNQRYVGRNWDFEAKPTSNMGLLAPEDHHLIQKAILAGPCGQVYTGNQVDEREHIESLKVRGICD